MKSKQLLQVLRAHTTDSLAKGTGYLQFRCEVAGIISRHRLYFRPLVQVPGYQGRETVIGQ